MDTKASIKTQWFKKDLQIKVVLGRIENESYDLDQSVIFSNITVKIFECSIWEFWFNNSCETLSLKNNSDAAALSSCELIQVMSGLMR